LQKGGYYAEMIKPQLMQKELDDEFQKEEFLRKATTKMSIDEEVHFENRVNELAVDPEEVVIDPTKIIKELWAKYKLETIFGTIAIVLLGVTTPIQGYYSGRGVNALNSNYQTIRYDNALKYGIIFLVVGLLNNIIHYIAFTTYFLYGINLAKIYRNKMMRKYLSFHLSYFDLDRNSPGSLLSKMSIDTMQLKIFSKRIIGNLITSIGVILCSLIVGCCYEWRLTLIVVAFMPLMIIITFIRRLTMQVDSPKSIESSMEGSRILSECVTNSKTIFAYNFSDEAVKLYLQAIDYITQQQNRDNLINGIAIGLEIFSRYCCYSSVYAATKRFVLNDTLTTDKMAVILSIAGVGFNSLTTLMRDIGHIRKAVAAIRSIYSTLDTESLIPPFPEDNINKTPADYITGKIEFKNVYFAYPTHPDNVILKNISFEILPGQRVALVGYSGCGKSSIIQLLNRFYDVEDGKGEILIDGINIKEYNLYELRKKIGLVSQEPSAFKGPSIENIRYGNLNATDEECFQAAAQANALNILEREKNINMDKSIKKKKNALSGGEKQKLAIGRIFLKNPKILLLDEPTSALDKESEIEIEKSLDILSMNKTTISIAHRLNTIKNYDKIIVLHKGRLYEQGTHEELMKLQKRYYALYKSSH
jgi:ATP-binding cassette subfamily B (MDR/TAP) protein 1